MPNHVHGVVWIADRSAVGARQPDGPFDEPGTPTSAVTNTDDAVASPLRTAVGRLDEPGTPKNAASNTDDAVASPLRTAVGPPSGSLGNIVEEPTTPNECGSEYGGCGCLALLAPPWPRAALAQARHRTAAAAAQRGDRLEAFFVADQFAA